MEESDDGAGDPSSATLGNRAACTDRSALCILFSSRRGVRRDMPSPENRCLPPSQPSPAQGGRGIDLPLSAPYGTGYRWGSREVAQRLAGTNVTPFVG